MEIERRLAAFPVPAEIEKQWQTNIVINNRGVAVDMELIYGALEIAYDTRQKLIQEAISITVLENPNSVSQFTKWLKNTIGENVDNLRKDTVTQMLEFVTGDAERVLRIRQELGKPAQKNMTLLRRRYVRIIVSEDFCNFTG